MKVSILRSMFLNSDQQDLSNQLAGGSSQQQRFEIRAGKRALPERLF